jgi:transposase
MTQLIGSTITDVARKEQITYDAVLGALYRQIAVEVSWYQIEELEVLGLDEIALKKGHRGFVVLVTTRDAEGQVKLLGVLPDRKLETVEKFLLTIPERLRATVREVCIDMYEGYASAVKKVLPQARAVADRFHVAKKYRDCADRLRIESQRDLKAGLSKEEYEALKGTMWLFRRDPEELDKEERERTSGFVEGFNNKVKVLKRRCYGITNLTHLFQRLYLDLGGYRLFGL